ncbi:MAG: hypothetical protein KatS3mg040_0057 [Candidatus Kapaibacterium sp.]|nr:MAG: hypothetical protein KatS3mg040_0057 [Candidatus Kapabacteria bacterium]
MVRIVTAALIGLIGSTALWCQIPQRTLQPTDTTVQRPPVALDVQPYYGVGFQLGFVSGVGFSFRYTSPQRFALEVNAGYITAGKNRAWYSFGIEGQYQFDNSLDSRFYGLAGLGYYADDKDSVGNVLSYPTRLGLGVGYEWFISRAAALALEVPVTFFIGEPGVQVFPTVQLGIVYYFR